MRTFKRIHIGSRLPYPWRTIMNLSLFIVCSMPFLLCLFTNWSVPYMPGISQEEMTPYSYKDAMGIIENGDILITFDSHFLNWRNGHAGIVVDATDGIVLEAKTLGVNSSFSNINRWRTYNSFAILRLTALSAEERSEVAAFSSERLIDVPYSLLPHFIELPLEDDGSVSGTHCSHLIWLSFMQYGYDLDSDGGFIVTPRDLYDSEHLHKVAVYTTSE